MRRIVTLVCLMFPFVCQVAHAQYVQVELPLSQLPEEHAYQKTLRAFMATLTEKDFEIDRKEITVAATSDPEALYRLWLLTLHMPKVGAATHPAASFTLKAFESQTKFVLPCVPSESQVLAWLANWNYPGNPYHNSKALKLRAFMLAATDTMLLDYLYDHDPRGADRADYLGGNLIWIGYTFQVTKDALPPEVRAAFEAGLKRLVVRMNGWGPRGAMTDMDLFAPVGLRYISQGSGDAELKQIAEDYSRQLFTQPRYFHPAGYFVDNGCFDTSYNGISLYFATWVALMSDWKFAREATDKAYRLRAHLTFPHPDGTFSGPSAMSSRCSGDPPRDQWQFPPKTYASGMVTDEAIHIAALPTEETLKNAPAAVVALLNAQLSDPRAPLNQSWRESHWSGSLNFAYDFYKPGDYAKRLQLAKDNAPLARPLYLRDENFVREFSQAFVIARFPGFAAAIHTGPVGGIHREWQRPYGFGGGELCAYWTPATGPAILGRRRGVQGPVFDSFAEWRLWPVHAVSGVTAAGDVVTSSRIEHPEVKSQRSDVTAEVRVSGTIPKYVAAQKQCVPTDLEYQREFLLNSQGLRVRTAVKSTGREKLTELYETIPVFLAEGAGQKIPLIRFQVGSEWMEATALPQTGVKTIEIERFQGVVSIALARPANVRLSPEVWKDGFQTQALCRTLLVDLLEPGAGTGNDVAVEYTISAASPQQRAVKAAANGTK